MSTLKISKHFQVKTNPATLFNAWISEDTAVYPVVKIESEPKINGRFILHAEMGDAVSIMNGKFLEIKPYKELSYTWNWQGSGEKTIVSVWFTEVSGGTALKLVHEGFQFKESLEAHDNGWDTYVEQLTKLLMVDN